MSLSEKLQKKKKKEQLPFDGGSWFIAGYSSEKARGIFLV